MLYTLVRLFILYMVAPAAMPLPAWQLQLHSIASGPIIVPYDLLVAWSCGSIVSSIVLDVEYLLLHGVERMAIHSRCAAPLLWIQVT